MDCLQKLGWTVVKGFNKTIYDSNDGIEFDLPTNQKFWEYDIKYKKMLRILSFYFNITQTEVENLIVNGDSNVDTNQLVNVIKLNVIPYKGLRVYHGQSLFYNSVVVLNYYLDKDNYIVVETMAFLKSNFKLEKAGTRTTYETRNVYATDKEYKIASICDALDMATRKLNDIYFERFENRQNPADYDYFRQSTIVKEILPANLIHVFGPTVLQDVQFSSKNAGFKEFQHYLEENVRYDNETIN